MAQTDSVLFILFYGLVTSIFRAFEVTLMVNNVPANAGDARDWDLIPGSGRYSGERNGNSLQYSCLGNPMDRGAWWATVHGLQRLRHDCATKHTHSFNTLPDIIGQALMQAQMVDSCTSVCLEGSCWWC